MLQVQKVSRLPYRSLAAAHGILRNKQEGVEIEVHHRDLEEAEQHTDKPVSSGVGLEDPDTDAEEPPDTHILSGSAQRVPESEVEEHIKSIR